MLRCLQVFVCVALIGQAQGDPVAIPVHRVPHACQESGFPLVLEQGILGCDKSGRVSRWYPFDDGEPSGTIDTLPEGSWLLGQVPFRGGMNGGLWHPITKDWSGPNSRTLSTIDEGQGFATEQHVLWSSVEAVHWMSLGSGIQRQHSAHPLQGQHPVWWKDSIAWVEWGNQPGIHLFNVQTAEPQYIRSEYPTSLVATAEGVYWICGGDICQWTSTGVLTQGRDRIHELYNSEKGLCWTQWLEGDVDILCEGGWRLKRAGDQSQPVWRGESLYFIESGKLWVYEEP